jgi:hypothetical protein
MKESFDKWWERLQFTLLFLALAVIVHGLFGWFHSWLTPDNPYREPEGRAFKVFQSGSGQSKADSPGDRLRLFLWFGE